MAFECIATEKGPVFYKYRVKFVGDKKEYGNVSKHSGWKSHINDGWLFDDEKEKDKFATALKEKYGNSSIEEEVLDTPTQEQEERIEVWKILRQHQCSRNDYLDVVNGSDMMKEFQIDSFLAWKKNRDGK